MHFKTSTPSSMRRLFTLVLAFITANAFSQLYFSDKKDVYYYVELNKDSAHVEVYKDFIYSVAKWDDVMLFTKGQGEVLFTSENNKIVKDKNSLYLLHKETPGKNVLRLKLVQAPRDDREGLRMESHYCMRKDQLYKLEDSLAGLTGKSTYTLNRDKDWTSSAGYIKELDKVFDSLSRKITRKADANAVRTYAIMDSLPQMSASDLLEYLKKAKFEYYYGQTLLYRMGTQRPEVLIAFLNKHPERKEEVLTAIRDHKYYKEIIASVKSWPEKTPVKKEIEKQKRKRMARDGAFRSLYFGLIAIEAVVIIGLIAFFVTR
jgi:hypothetical protein